MNLGIDSGNYWWYRRRDVGALYERMETQLPGAQVDGLFLAITTLKDPGHRHDGLHTLEMFTFVPYAPFGRYPRLGLLQRRVGGELGVALSGLRLSRRSGGCASPGRRSRPAGAGRTWASCFCPRG